jgi:Skp family chaperone for outer membrane proteins
MELAVVDIQKLLSESSAAVKLQEQLSKERKKFQEVFSGYERELKEDEQKLAEQKSSLSSEAFAEKRDAFEQKLLETSRLAKKRKRELDEAFNRALGRLREQIIKAAAEIAKKEGYKVVLTKQYVVVLEKEIDITEKVLENLNSQLPELSLDIKNR